MTTSINLTNSDQKYSLANYAQHGVGCKISIYENHVNEYFAIKDIMVKYFPNESYPAKQFSLHVKCRR